MKLCLFILSVHLTFQMLMPKAEGTPGKWQEKMTALASTIGELLPELVMEKSDLEILQRGAKKLSELSHDLKEGRKSGKLMPPTDDDPSVTLIAERFSEEAKFAYLAIQRGQLEYGKNYLRSIVGYCIACHTRHENGPQFPFFPLNPKTERLSPAEKAELFIATRQFDRGLVELQKLIKDEEFASAQPFRWERPLRQALAIAVRVKQDPSAASEMIDTALSLKKLPHFEKAYLEKWRAAIETWRKDPIKNFQSEKKSFASMKHLIEAARSVQTYRLDRSAEVEYLRASGTAHDLLRIAKDPKIRAEALFTLGLSYEALSKTSLWPMHDLWYESCVRELPHSAIAERCYQNLEESIFFGYTGSAGTQIPEEVKRLLKEMKALALVTQS